MRRGRSHILHIPAMSIEEKKEFDVVPEAVTNKSKLLQSEQLDPVIPSVFSTAVLDAFQLLAELDRFLMWGYQVKKVLARLGIKVYKFTEASSWHNGYQFVNGHNADPQSARFSLMSCSSGKFYCAFSTEFDHWFEYNGKIMQNVWDVLLRDESRVVFEDKFKCGVDEFELSNERPIRELAEWKSREVLRHAYLDEGIVNAFRVPDHALPPIVRFQAIACDKYPDTAAKKYITTASVSSQYALVKAQPSLILEIESPHRALIMVALQAKPGLIHDLREDLADDELIHFALQLNPMLLADFSVVKEEWIRAVFEMFSSMWGICSMPKGLRQLLILLARRKVAISDELLVWLVESVPDCGSELLTLCYDSDAVRKAIITNCPNDVRLFCSIRTGRPLSEELKWHALRLQSGCIDVIPNADEKMFAYAVSMKASLAITQASSTQQMLIVLSTNPEYIAFMKPPILRDFIATALSKNPSLWDRIPGNMLKTDVVRICPFVLWHMPRHRELQHLPFVAIEGLRMAYGDHNEHWLAELRRSQWFSAEVEAYFFKIFPHAATELVL